VGEDVATAWRRRGIGVGVRGVSMRLPVQWQRDCSRRLCSGNGVGMRLPAPPVQIERTAKHEAPAHRSRQTRQTELAQQEKFKTVVRQPPPQRSDILGSPHHGDGKTSGSSASEEWMCLPTKKPCSISAWMMLAFTGIEDASNHFS